MICLATALEETLISRNKKKHNTRESCSCPPLFVVDWRVEKSADTTTGSTGRSMVGNKHSSSSLTTVNTKAHHHGQLCLEDIEWKRKGREGISAS